MRLLCCESTDFLSVPIDKLTFEELGPESRMISCIVFTRKLDFGLCLIVL